ncbi:MAG: HAD-IC family P-type ATPase, partial [Oscillospiraceae bacterium]|nr:HAD-IC family P-type ATPase [Oscillospiraceae bacterium]
MQGLSTQEVEERKNKGLVNEEVSSSTRTVKEIVKENILTYYNLIFAVLAVLLIIVGQFKDLTFLLIVGFNAAIGIAQEIRSKQILDNLKFEKMPRVTAIRDGREQEVVTEELVKDDIVVLGAGAQIPADAEVISGSCQVNEALVTGESDEISKSEGDQLLSGSFVISGECKARLTAVGKESYISKLQVEATKQGKKDGRSQMVRDLDKLVMIIGILIIPIGIVLFVQQFYIMHNSFQASVTSMVAAVLGMIPEGLYMLASVAMVVSAMRLARQEVLVQNMRSIETLARVDVLCVDKTGTITESEMKVDGMQSMMPEKYDGQITTLIGDLVKEMDADNATMQAMQEYFTDTSDRKAVRTIPFSSKYKYCAAIYDDGNYILGAPEFVLGESYAEYETQ